METHAVLGRGIYSTTEAARLTGLTRSKVDRWAFGYRDYRGIVDPDLPNSGPYRSISFLTLMELYLMRRLQDKGIAAEKFRIAAGELARLKGVEHPFAFEHLGEFLLHDNKDFFLQEEDLTQITGHNRDNMVLKTVIKPYLQEVEFEAEYVRRWFPVESDRLIVVDPAIKFGEPVVSGTRVPTANIIDQMNGGDSASFVAECYGLTLAQVEAAEGFERRFNRAA